jgi:hypothetical protein
MTYISSSQQFLFKFDFYRMKSNQREVSKSSASGPMLRPDGLQASHDKSQGTAPVHSPRS